MGQHGWYQRGSKSVEPLEGLGTDLYRTKRSRDIGTSVMNRTLERKEGRMKLSSREFAILKQNIELVRGVAMTET